MAKLVVLGGRRLSGSVEICCAKNSVLPIISASILTKEQVVIKKCPKINDVLSMIEIIKKLGVSCEFNDGDLVVNSKNLASSKVDKTLAKELRASVLLMGALISRENKAEIPNPGGCEIGQRPTDIHIKALKQLGVKFRFEDERLLCTCSKIKGAKIELTFPSVGATENAMLASVLAEGKTEIRNAAREPEIVDLMKFLNSMGAKVYGAGTSIILIEGVKELHGTEYTPMSDRIEAGTFMVATAITGGELEIKGCNAKNISHLLHKLCDNACKITTYNDIIYIKSKGKRKAFSFSTGPYPDFPTDLQPQTMVLSAISNGVSVINETVFENRFKHVCELKKMGADISTSGRTAVVNGVKNLVGAQVVSSDLRGGAALVLAGLVAEGETIVEGINHIDRGYFEFDKKLLSLGAEIKRKDN